MAAPASDALPAGVVNNPEAGHQTGVFPPFEAHNFLSQIIWLAIIFGLLYWLMSRVALPRVEGILDARRSRIGKDLDDARLMQDQAQAAGVAYDKTLAEAKGRAQTLAQQTHDKLHTESEAKRQSLEAGLNVKLAVSEAQIADMKTRAMANVETIARDAASVIIHHLTGKAVSPEAIAAAATATKQ